MDMIIQFFNSAPAWVAALTGLVTAATAITAMTPSKADDKIVNSLLKALNFLAGNFGMNKNKDDE